MTRLPPALWLALLGMGFTGTGLAAWSARGGTVRGVDAGAQTEPTPLRDSTPELAARSYFDALRTGRAEQARSLRASSGTSALSEANRRVLRDVPHDGRSSLRVDESHRLAQGSWRLIGVLTVEGAARTVDVGARFDVATSTAGYRIAHMQLNRGPVP